MYIKSINNVEGYKDLPDGFKADFDENVTYIIGGNFKRKTTVGSLFSWCLTGASLYGKEKEQVENDLKKGKTVVVDITFIDNLGIEHRLIRTKGKKMTLVLDEKEVNQERLGEFYIDKDIFLVAHNPYYFCSIEPKQQKNLFRKIIPSIESEKLFELLDAEEQKIIERPIDFINNYIESGNSDIKDIEKEIARNNGALDAFKQIALTQEGEILEFEKEDRLSKLVEENEKLSFKLNDSSIKEIKKKIDILDKKIEENIKVKLKEIANLYKREEKKIIDLKSNKPICPICKQEIQEKESTKSLINFYEKELKKLQEKANNLKEETKTLAKERKQKMDLYEKLNTPDMKKIEEYKQDILNEIEKLSEEKQQIILNNKEVKVKEEQIKEAKRNIKNLTQLQEELNNDLELTKKQIKIAKKLKMLEIERQKDEINKYLDKVEVIFLKKNKTNDNMVDCCEIKYEGREYNKLSKSQQAKAALEISNLFNNLSKINAPVFFDDAESTTEINIMKDTQMIISIVVKDNPLEILYDYNDVLERRKKSLEREIEDKNSCFLKQAA